MFRCPCCAKVWKMPLTNGYSLLAHKDLNKWYIVKEPISLYSTFEPVEDLTELSIKLKELGITFQTKGDNYVECPACGTYSKTEAWVRAWEYPSDFFDADHICSCGGELWWDKIPGTPRYALVCEKCDWVKPKAIISGHEE